MNKLVALLQLLPAIVLAIVALATLVNPILIGTRRETISVVNAFIGQGVAIVALLALATVSLRKGLKNLRQADPTSQNQD